VDFHPCTAFGLTEGEQQLEFFRSCLDSVAPVALHSDVLNRHDSQRHLPRLRSIRLGPVHVSLRLLVPIRVEEVGPQFRNHRVECHRHGAQSDPVGTRENRIDAIILDTILLECQRALQLPMLYVQQQPCEHTGHNRGQHYGGQPGRKVFVASAFGFDTRVSRHFHVRRVDWTRLRVELEG